MYNYKSCFITWYKKTLRRILLRTLKECDSITVWRPWLCYS